MLSVLALLRNLLCTYHEPPQSQHRLLPAAGSNQQTPRVDRPHGDDPHHAVRAHPVLRLPLPMQTGQRLLVPRPPRWQMSQQHRARRVGFRDLGPQRDRRLDFRYPAILDRQGLADPRPTETTSDRPARFRRGGFYGDGCTLTIRARAQGEREG
jgi:hypothetical protein